MEAACQERDVALGEVADLRQQVMGMERKVEQAAQLLTDAAQWNKSLQNEVARLKTSQRDTSHIRMTRETTTPRATEYIIQPSPYERGLGAVQRLDTLLNRSANEFSQTQSPGYPEGAILSTAGASTLQYF